MKKWYQMVPDGSCDYAIVNRTTGETEAIIARNHGHRGLDQIRERIIRRLGDLLHPFLVQHVS